MKPSAVVDTNVLIAGLLSTHRRGLNRAGAPAGAAIHPATGMFSWHAPQFQSLASYQVTVTAYDADAPTFNQSKTFTLT